MKASNMIQLLQKAIREYGDHDVVHIDGYDGKTTLPVAAVTVEAASDYGTTSDTGLVIVAH